MDYQAAATRAEMKIGKYGCPVIFHHVAGSHDPISGITAGSPSETVAYGLLTRPSDAEIASGSVQYGDAILLVSAQALATPPCPGWLVELGGNKWRIQSVDMVAPNGISILYRIGIRRG